MLQHPLPGVRDYVLQVRLLRHPPQLFPDLLARRNQDWRVPSPARGLDDFQCTPRDASRRLDDLPYREAGAVTEVVDAVLAGLRLAGSLQRQKVCPRQI